MTMAEAAVKIEPRELAFVRRFEQADLTTHGPWLMKRFMTKLPDVREQHIGGYLRGLIADNEHLFLYQDNGVALAQIVHNPGLRMVKVVQERFVWVRNREDKAQQEMAADFYDHFKAWARRLGAERIIVREDSDVPKGLIEARLGRLFDTTISHARV
jgi:hypothetical protein